MGKHAIIVIKNEFNEYLQYYDSIWKSFLFPNLKLEDTKIDTIKSYVKEKYNLAENKINCLYIEKLKHSKFSVSANRIKDYEHYFYSVDFEIPDVMKHKNFKIDDIEYSWMSYEELRNDKRIEEVNSDIVEFIKEINL